MVLKLEALADALGFMNGVAVPDSKAYQNRNPGLLRSFSLIRHQETDDQGVRIFSSFIGGYRALLHDLTVRCQGHGRATIWRQDSGKPEKLRVDSPLRDLLKTYGMRAEDPILKVANFLRKALRDESIGINTPINFFAADLESVQPPVDCQVKQKACSDAVWLGLGIATGSGGATIAEQMQDEDWRNLKR